MLRIRGITEHAGYAPNPDQRLNARTVINPVETFFFAPHGVNYHVEHHVYPSVPHFRLPEVHRLMSERGALPAASVLLRLWKGAGGAGSLGRVASCSIRGPQAPSPGQSRRE